jgi:hypothetical protein
LPDPSIDNYDWASALSFYDYDAVVVDPAEAVSKLVEGIARGEAYHTYDNEPIVDGPSSASGVGLAELLKRRREETERLLARGGLVVCFAHPDVPHPSVSGFTGCHRYYWLPAPAGADYGRQRLKPAGGSKVGPTDYEHPFAAFLEDLGEAGLYRVAFAEGTAGLGKGAKVIGRSAGGAAVAVDLSVGGGRVVFLPALSGSLSGSERSRIAHGLVTAIRNSLLLEAEETPPAWLDAFDLPGLADAKAKADAAEARLENLEAELAAARNEYRSIDRYRRLLWQAGKYGFELPVRDALTLLGFAAVSGMDEPAVLRYDGTTVLLETEASTGYVGMEPHYRLRQRLEKAITTKHERPHGVIVINGYRDAAPAGRSQQYDEALRVAAESMRYCIVTATQLYEAVRDKLAGRGEAEAVCRRLLETEGAYVPANEQSEPAVDQSAEPAATGD